MMWAASPERHDASPSFSLFSVDVAFTYFLLPVTTPALARACLQSFKFDEVRLVGRVGLTRTTSAMRLTDQRA